MDYKWQITTFNRAAERITGVSRREDIPNLVDHIVARFNHPQGQEVAGISLEAITRLMYVTSLETSAN